MNALDKMHELRKQLDATDNPEPKQLAELLSIVTRQLVHISEELQGVPRMGSGPIKHRE